MDLGVTGVLVADEEGRLDAAPVGIHAALSRAVLARIAQYLLVVVEHELIDGAAEGQQDHLRHLTRLELAGNGGSIGGTETIGQTALPIASGQRVLRVLSGLVLFHLLLVANWPTGERGRLEGTKLELRIEIKSRRAGLRPRMRAATQDETFA